MLLTGKREVTDTTESAEPALTRRARFRAWRRERPFLGGILVVLSGIELFFSGQLDFGRLHIQLGIEGLQATIIPLVLVLLGILAIAMPAHHVFYGVIALAVAVYALVGVNLGGFLLGTIIGCVGGVLVVAWMPWADRERNRAAKREKPMDAGAGEDARGGHPSARPRCSQPSCSPRRSS